MFNVDDLKVNFNVELNPEPQLVIIPVNNEYGIIAVVKPVGNGQAACVAFSPATRLDNPFKGYRPHFLRKIKMTDFLLRAGLRKLSLDKPNAMTLQQAVVTLLKDFEKLDPATVRVIDMRRPTNASSSPEVSAPTYEAPESVPFERALAHLMGLEFTMAARAKQQADLLIQATNASKASSSGEVPASTEVEASHSAQPVGVAAQFQTSQSAATSSDGISAEAVHSSSNSSSDEGMSS